MFKNFLNCFSFFLVAAMLSPSGWADQRELSQKDLVVIWLQILTDTATRAGVHWTPEDESVIPPGCRRNYPYFIADLARRDRELGYWLAELRRTQAAKGIDAIIISPAEAHALQMVGIVGLRFIEAAEDGPGQRSTSLQNLLANADMYFKRMESLSTEVAKTVAVDPKVEDIYSIYKKVAQSLYTASEEALRQRFSCGQSSVSELIQSAEVYRAVALLAAPESLRQSSYRRLAELSLSLAKTKREGVPH